MWFANCSRMPHQLLIIEDDPALGQMLAMHFEDVGFEVEVERTCRSGLARLKEAPSICALGPAAPGRAGERSDRAVLKAWTPDLPVIMMTGQHDLELAIEAIQRGAADFVHKPIKVAELQQTVERLLRHRKAAAGAGGRGGRAGTWRAA
jgi:DNA-binding NtrC family response regulator